MIISLNSNKKNHKEGGVPVRQRFWKEENTIVKNWKMSAPAKAGASLLNVLL